MGFCACCGAFSGAALMSLKMVGSHTGSLFGSSIYVWGSLIGVVLTALSLGYYTGGYLSDCFPRLLRYSIVFAIAGVWTGHPVFSERLLPCLASRNSGHSVAPELQPSLLCLLFSSQRFHPGAYGLP